MRTGTSIGLIAAEEVRRAYNNFWARLAMLFVLAYTIVYLGNLYTRAGAAFDPLRVHTMQNFYDFLGIIRWGALAIIAIMAGPSLIEDHRRGALELYYTRAVSRAEYLGGKILATFSVAFASVFLPAIVYYLSVFFLLDDQPDDWNKIPGGAFVYAAMWALLVSGLGLGISSAARSSRGATLFLLGGFAGLDIFVSKLMANITKNEDLQILSPFAALDAQTDWLFNLPQDLTFPYWWGLVVWAGLVAFGWGLLAWKQPRVRGEERARA